VGSDWTVKAGLEKLVRQTGADEVIVVTDTYEQADRLESYRRVAEIAAEMRIDLARRRSPNAQKRTVA
jgi:CO dehydrogenase nickel-insertion accessory protein CooC1